MNTATSFHPTRDRYAYDTEKCCFSDGWSQIDSQQDAWYYGQWANPAQLKYVSFTEGDVTERSFDQPSEFVEFIQSLAQWHRDRDDSRFGIDPGFPGLPQTEASRDRWTELGLSALLH